MPLTEFSKAKKFIWILLILLIALAFTALNVLAYSHAKSILNYATEGQASKSPRDLNRLEKWKILLKGPVVMRPAIHALPSDFKLDYEEITVKSSDNLTISGWFIPRENPVGTVLLCHGYGSNKSGVLMEAKEMYNRGWQILTIDLRGSGDSDDSQTSFGYYEALDVEAAVKWIEESYPEMPLLCHGQSMGSAAILKAIEQKLIAPDYIILESPFNTFKQTMKNRFELMNKPSFPALQCLIFWGGVQLKTNANEHNPRDYAASVNCPALVLIGENDPYVKQNEAKEVADTMKAAFKVMTHCAHESYAQKNPELYGETISNWLKSLNRTD